MLLFLTSVYLVLLLIRPQDFVPAMEGVPLLQGLILTCFVVWLLTDRKYVRTPQFGLLATLAFFVAFSVGINGWWGGGVPALERFLPPALFFVVLTKAARSLGAMRYLATLIIGCACIHVLHGVQQIEQGIGWTGERPKLGRITYAGILSDPNDLAMLFVVSIGFAVYLVAGWRGALRRIAAMTAIGWLLYGLYLTNSRGGMLAALTLAGLLIWRRFGIVMASVLGILGLPALFAATRLSTIDVEEESTEGRIDAWYTGIELFQANPFFGVGFGGFTDYHHLTAHNSLVLPMAELGVFGYFVWFSFLALSGWMLYLVGYRYPATIEGEPTAEAGAEVKAAQGLAMVMVSFLVAAFFLSQSYKFLFFTICGFAVARFLGAREKMPDLPAVSFTANFRRLAIYALGSVVFMWLLVKFLIRVL